MNKKMNQNTKKFDVQLRKLLNINELTTEEFALRLDVTVPVVCRWLSGSDVPDVYLFHKIVRFFDVSYNWFLDGTTSTPSAAEMADRLGLSVETVETLMELSDKENDDVLDELDNAIYYLAAAVMAVPGDS